MTVEIRQDPSGMWRWRLIDDDGELVCASGSEFATEEAATRAAHYLWPGAERVQVVRPSLPRRRR